MSKYKEQVTVYKCGGCGRESIQRKDEDLPDGYYGGKITVITGSGGNGCSEWFACSEDCIINAIYQAIWGNED